MATNNNNSNNTIDKFGRSKRLGSSSVDVIRYRGPSGVGFKLTPDKHFDIQDKCLKNVGEPVDGTDSATRDYVDKCMSMISGDVLNALKDSISFTATSMRNYVNESLHKSNADLRKQMEVYVQRHVVEVKQDTILMKKRIQSLEKDVASKGILIDTSVNHKALSNAGILQSLHRESSL